MSAPLPFDGPRAHAPELQHQEKELLQKSLSALYATMGAKEQVLRLCVVWHLRGACAVHAWYMHGMHALMHTGAY